MARSSSRRNGYPAAIFAINFWSTLHFLAVLLLAVHRPLLALAVLYLLPPLLARLLMAGFGKPSGQVPVRSREFLVWWALASLQMVFARLPFLEELLRMVPTLYSNWLRLWGSKVGRLVYWSPGTVVLDRSYLDIGNEVVLGVGSKLCPHHVDSQRLSLAPITVGHGAQVGGYGILLAGCLVGPGETTPGSLKMRAYSAFLDGRLVRSGRPSQD